MGSYSATNFLYINRKVIADLPTAATPSMAMVNFLLAVWFAAKVSPAAAQYRESPSTTLEREVVTSFPRELKTFATLKPNDSLKFEIICAFDHVLSAIIFYFFPVVSEFFSKITRMSLSAI